MVNLTGRSVNLLPCSLLEYPVPRPVPVVVPVPGTLVFNPGIGDCVAWPLKNHKYACCSKRFIRLIVLV